MNKSNEQLQKSWEILYKNIENLKDRYPGYKEDVRKKLNEILTQIQYTKGTNTQDFKDMIENFANQLSTHEKKVK